jgi:hypothetical protein
MKGVHGEACSTYMEQFPCKALGFGEEDAGDTDTFYTPDDLPKNGTKPLFNNGGEVSSPISGATFTWTFGTVQNAITVSSTDYVATATATNAAGDSVSSGSTATETGASSTSTGLAAGSGVSAMAIVGPVIAIVYVL